MKKIAITLSVIIAFILLVVIIVCIEPEQATNGSPKATTPSTTEAVATCAEHDFIDATFISPRKCKICEATEGEPLCVQCETWEDVVALAGFDEYSYDLQVIDSSDNVILFITINDFDLPETEEGINNFMLNSFLSFLRISWFSQNRLTGNTPELFQVDTSIRLNFPGGNITCMPIGTRNGFGFSTMLSCEDDSPNKQVIENAYDKFFQSVSMN